MCEPVNKGMEKVEIQRIVKKTMEEWRECELTVFTDGSATEGTSSGGSAAVCYQGQEVVVKMVASGGICSSFDTEVVAMQLAVESIKERRPRSAVIVTDSQSLVKALDNEAPTMDHALETLKEGLVEVQAISPTVVQWTPSHVGTEGNERADAEAKEAGLLNQEGVPVGWNATKAAIKREIRYTPQLNNRLSRVYTNWRPREGGGRREDVVMAQLRSGHCPSTSYYMKRIGSMEQAGCEDCGESDEKDHILECPRWAAKRRKWGLVGRPEDLREVGVVGYLREVKPDWFV